MVNLKDVAAHAGVSLGTVSRVINDNPEVAAELRARVQGSVEALGYQPNALGRNLRRQRTDTFGIVIPDVTSPFFAELVKQVEQAARDHGYSLLVGSAENSRELEISYLNKLTERGVDGVIFSSSSEGSDGFPVREGSPLVTVDREVPGFDFVSSDHEAGARSAVAHLVELGHRRVACISGPQSMPVFAQRLTGYRTVMGEVLKGEDLRADDYTRVEPIGEMRGVTAAHELLQMNPPPTAIFATSDQQAIGVLRACADSGLRVPEHVSVVGFDDIPLAELLTPRLTTVRQPIDEIGRLAIDRLAARVSGKSGRSTKQLLPTELVVRESTGQPPADGRG